MTKAVGIIDTSPENFLSWCWDHTSYFNKRRNKDLEVIFSADVSTMEKALNEQVIVDIMKMKWPHPSVEFLQR